MLSGTGIDLIADAAFSSSCWSIFVRVGGTDDVAFLGTGFIEARDARIGALISCFIFLACSLVLVLFLGGR